VQRHEKTRHGRMGIGAVTGFENYSTTGAVSRVVLSKLGDNAFRMIADLALKSEKIMVHLE